MSNEGEDAMSDGLGGTEMDEVLVLRSQRPSLQKRNGKGKERAEMRDGGERNRKK